MKTGFQVDQLWFSAPGGIGTYVRELARALADDDGVDLTLFHCRFSEPGPAWLSDFPTLEIPGPIRTLYPQWDLAGRPKLPPAFDGFDVIHATNPASVPPVRRRQALVVTVHDLAFEHHPDLFPTSWRWLYRAGVRAAVKRAAAILVPTQSTADDLLSRHHLDAERVHVTPLGASLPASAADPDPVVDRLGITRPYVLSVGTQEPRKNLVRLLRAYRQVAPDVPHTLVLAGAEGWGNDDLRLELDRPGAGTIVRTGHVSDRDLDALYRGADAFAYLSLYEGFGLPVVEALARGVPSVVSATSSLPEVVGDAAVLVDPEDVGEIADALARVLTDRRVAEDLRRRGRERAAGFTWETTARATLDAYRRATGAA
ncbi:MAG: glycosyltransferase family 4 protein [Actinomycetota bacterium]